MCTQCVPEPRPVSARPEDTGRSPGGVLFDVDGTLVDTPYLHAVCWSEALRQAGHDVPMATTHRAIGMGSDELLDHLLGDDRDKAGDEMMSTAHLTLYKQFWGRLRPLPGARELLTECARRGLRVVLASSATQEELEALRSVAGCRRHHHHGHRLQRCRLRQTAPRHP